MKKTTVEWFCDKCGSKIPDRPKRIYYIKTNGNKNPVNRVTIEFRSPDIPMCTSEDGRSFESSMLCSSCKKDIVEVVLKELKSEVKKGW